MKSFLTKLILIISSTCLTIIAVEIIFNSLNLIPALPKKNWDWVLKYSQYTPDNQLIYRPKKIFRENPSQQVNTQEKNISIVVVGDSFAYGDGVNPEHAFPAFLERQLRSQQLPVTINNAGVPGYGFDQEFLYLKNHLIPKYQPHLVIWSFNLNDPGDSNDACLFKSSSTSYQQLSAKHNTLYLKQLIYPKIPPSISQSRLFALLDSRIPERFTLGCSQMNTDYESQTDKLTFFLESIKPTLKQHSTTLLVVLNLNQHFFTNNPNDPDWHYKVANADNIKNSLIGSLTQTHTNYLDANNLQILGASVPALNQGLFLEETNFDLGWRHPNETGYQFLATQISKKIIKDKILE